MHSSPYPEPPRLGGESKDAGCSCRHDGRPRRSLAPARAVKDSAAPRPRGPSPMTDRVLILDFGSQVTQLIARRLRENGVYCEIQPYSLSPERLEAFEPKAVILSGGPASVHEANSPRAPMEVFQ